MSKKAAYPPLSGKETEVLGIRTHYYQMGDARNRPLLLVHGMTTSADSFRETMHGLADNYFMIAPDLPGFGLTDEIQPFTIEHLSYWLYTFCEQLSLKRFGLIGHSFGGVIALCFAAMFPDLVSRMLLAAPPVYNAQSYPGYLRRLALVSGAYALGVALSKSWPLIHWRVRSPFYAPDLVDEDVFHRRAVDYRHARASAQALKTLAFSDLDPCAEQTIRPVCLVWGEDDETVPLGDADRLAAHFDDVCLQIIPACGHVTVAEKPEQFVAIAAGFFSQGE
ncbi:MAG: alpha/beta fold hydrolase [Candidatus Promineifilaceae bacterium]